MPCYNPLSGFIGQDGKFRMKQSVDSRPQVVKCGNCVGCRLDRSREWAIRCMHEASLWEDNCFITLTYDSTKLPVGYDISDGLVYSHFQEFMKRFRFHYKGHQALPDGSRPIRFYMAGEYGSENGRPHFHACIFNFKFDDLVYHHRSASGQVVYTSQKLEELWPFGFSSVGTVTFQSAAYVARYIMKKVNGKSADAHYSDPYTGQLRSPEFNKMSLKPGIGARWLDKFCSDVYPHDYVVVNGKRCKPPRYYDKRLLKNTLQTWVKASQGFMPSISDDGFWYTPIEILEFSPILDDIQFSRYENSRNFLDDNTPDRLSVKEALATRRLKLLKRTL